MKNLNNTTIKSNRSRNYQKMTEGQMQSDKLKALKQGIFNTSMEALSPANSQQERDKAAQDMQAIASTLINEVERKEKELKKKEDEIKDIENALIKMEENMNSQFFSKMKSRDELENNFRAELVEREKEFQKKEQSLIARQKDMERSFSEQSKKYEEMRDNIQNELIKKERELQQLLVDTEREKERYQEESRKALESKSKNFVQDALATLTKKEDNLKTKGTTWSVCGALSILFGIIFSIYIMIANADSFHNTSDNNLTYYLYMLFRGVIVIGLFIALSRYCFIYSNSFMHESLKISERTHAIKYGEFYLDISGADADWDSIKEAFSNWNINGKSAFYEAKEKDSENFMSKKEVTELLDSRVGDVIKTITPTSKQS